MLIAADHRPDDRDCEEWRGRVAGSSIRVAIPAYAGMTPRWGNALIGSTLTTDHIGQGGKGGQIQGLGALGRVDTGRADLIRAQ